MRKKVNLVCDNPKCKKKFTRDAYYHDEHAGHYCSLSCYHASTRYVEDPQTIVDKVLAGKTLEELRKEYGYSSNTSVSIFIKQVTGKSYTELTIYPKKLKIAEGYEGRKIGKLQIGKIIDRTQGSFRKIQYDYTCDCGRTGTVTCAKLRGMEQRGTPGCGFPCKRKRNQFDSQRGMDLRQVLGLTGES